VNSTRFIPFERENSVAGLQSRIGNKLLETQWINPMPPFSLRPYERLRHSKDFVRVRKHSTHYRTVHFRVNCVPNGFTINRLGMVVQKRFWNAVQRNRIKRCLREFFRLHKHLIAPPPRDIVIIAMPGAERLSAKEVAIEIFAVLEKEEKRAP